jgi:hypothetical protein
MSEDEGKVLKVKVPYFFLYKAINYAYLHLYVKYEYSQ